MEFFTNPQREGESEVEYYERLVREKAETGTEMDKLAYEMILKLKAMQQNPINALDPDAFRIMARQMELYRQGELLDDSIEQLIEKLKDSDFQVRMRAAQRLGEQPDVRAVEPLIAGLRDPMEGVRICSASALGNIKDERAIKPLIDALRDSALNVRNQTGHAIEAFGAQATLPLVEALADEDADIRCTIAYHLGEIRDPRALPALAKAAQNDPGVTSWGEHVKDAAAAAVRSTERTQRKTKLEQQPVVAAAGGFDWESLMRDWSDAMLASNRTIEDLPQEAIDAPWLGFPGATEEQIAQAEARLGTTFPPSYRAFLKMSNGWRALTHSIYDISTTEQVDWLITRTPFWVGNEGDYDFMEPVTDEEYFLYDEEQVTWQWRPEYLKTTLQITDIGDMALYLLNPKVVTPEGEWEAWSMASWSPEGPARYRSFWDLMQAEYKLYLEVEGLNS